MAHFREGAEFAFEAIDVCGFGARQGFERDRFVHLAVVGFIHHTHAAGPETAAQREPFSTRKFGGGLSHLQKPLKAVATIGLTDEPLCLT